jgi:RNA polymerase sigma-70 factor (ECF subfamily)
MSGLESLSDEELLQAALEGSDAHFNALVDRYAASIYRLAYGITGRREDAEDIVQETFLRVYGHLDQYASPRGSVKTWLFTIARNQSINVFSSIKRSMARFWSEQSSDQERGDPLEAHPSSPHMDAERQLSVQQELEMVQRALAKLPQRQRTALLLKAQEDLSYEEIAQVMGTSVSSVESLIFRARQRIMETLGDD